MRANKECSYIFYLSSQFQLLSLQEIDNQEFKDKNIFNYILNEKERNGATFCYLCTQDESIYKLACKFVGTMQNNLFVDAFYSPSENSYKSARASMEYLGVVLKDKKPIPKRI